VIGDVAGQPTLWQPFGQSRLIRVARGREKRQRAIMEAVGSGHSESLPQKGE
jgi:hypothetical protein